jgi:M6 family metalloprotease-like protein
VEDPLRRRVLGLVAIATIPLLATSLQLPATASPAAGSGTDGARAAKADDRSSALDDERRRLNQKAVRLVLNGERQVRTRSGSTAVRVEGQWAELGVTGSDQIFTTLVEFGERRDRKYKNAPAGPVHNQIPQPDRSVDNTTYWTADFNRQHYLDMFFNGLADQNGESVKKVYEEMSSGQYTVDGDVGDWVQVEWNEAHYGETESNKDMSAFIKDGADAWYAAQQAAGKTDAQIREYLAGFDKWDRYDHDGDGDFAESDGYLDHYQAIHAGEGEEAGAPTWAIWSHRWYANQAGRGKVGPSPDAELGGVEIGDSGIWIGDYTTEPENGGIGVFAHEYAHDLGLPDLYDTAGGENGTGFWTLMSSGSWLGHGEDTIGTTPNHMGAWEKLQLGWLSYEEAQTGATSTHELAPSAQPADQTRAVVVTLPDNKGYYIAENRQYSAYDATLEVGPYNFGWTATRPDQVEHFPYQNGLLVTYWNPAHNNNNASEHPGAGEILPVDANPTALTWSDGAVVRNRIQTFDSTFGLEDTDPIALQREVADPTTGAVSTTTLSVPAQAANPLFDDSDPNAYYDPANPQGSVQVAGTGTQIEVVGSSDTGGLTVQVR